MKNIKKAEQKKRRALERRASEGDAEHMSADKSGPWMVTQKKPSQSTDDEDSQTDSGLASSVEESSRSTKRVTPSARKSTKQTKKRATGGAFLKEANPDLIFDLDF
jgi:hypothetical protein